MKSLEYLNDLVIYDNIPISLSIRDKKEAFFSYQKYSL